MDYALEERIGQPELFTGRHEELAFFLNWVENIKERKSESTAILGRPKIGKTALMQRLYNIVFHQSSGVIPFYYKIKKIKMWQVDFCIDFFLDFVYQYIAFKSRNPNYLALDKKNSLECAKKDALKEGLDYLAGVIENVEFSARNEHIGMLWNTVRDAAEVIASSRAEFIVQMIDDYQFLNSTFYRDKEMKTLANDLTGGYLSTAESKIAPLIVSGGFGGWMGAGKKFIPLWRSKFKNLDNMAEDEAVEMIFKYSRYFNVSITEESVYMIANMTEGNPFYINSIMRSSLPDKDLTRVKGLTDVFAFETLDDGGMFKVAWLEHIDSAFPQVMDWNDKRIVIHLSRNRDRELTRKEILESLILDMPDDELEKKLKVLVQTGLISQGATNFRYSGLKDNIFDKVFRGLYEEETRDIPNKGFKEKIETLRKQYGRLEQENLERFRELYENPIKVDKIERFTRRKL